MWGESMAFRKPSDSELRLLRCLVKATRSPLADRFLEGILVESMNDGGMGSLRLLSADNSGRQAVFHHVASECRFRDRDGVDVIASLYVDANGDPFELDMWKVTYTPLLEIPVVLPDAQVPSE